MLLDVLSGIDELKVAVAYEIDGKRIDRASRARSPTSSSAGRSTRRSPAGARTSRSSQAVVRPPRACQELCRVPGQTSAGARDDRLGRPGTPADDLADRWLRLRRSTSTPRTTETHGDHRRRTGADRGGRVETRAAPAAHRHHHGWQRAMGPAARAAADRRSPPRNSERPLGRRGRVPAGARSVDALLPLGRELEAAAARADVLDASAPPLPGRRARRADGAERPAQDDRPPRRSAARRARASSSGRPSRRPRTTG